MIEKSILQEDIAVLLTWTPNNKAVTAQEAETGRTAIRNRQI